ncbi:hypothetical protein ACVFYP_26110 [Roseomonas sp. F4]
MALRIPALRALRHRLDEAFAPVDAEILAAGDRLGQAVTRLNDINASFEGLRQTLDGEAVGAAAAMLGEAAGAMRVLAEQLRQEGAALSVLNVKLGEVGTCIGALARVNRGLSVLSVNSAISSSSIIDTSRDLSSFAEEIRALMEISAGAVRRYEQSHAAALTELRRVSAAQADFTRQHGALLGGVAERITTSLGHVATRRRQAMQAAAAVQERGQSIVGAVGDTVSALQVGDATRQRIEHVVDALGLLAEGLGGAPLPWCVGLEPPERDALAARAAAMQAAQLRDTGEALSAEIVRISAALARLGEQAHGMVGTGETVFGGKGDGSFLTTMQRDLHEATALLGECHARRRQVDVAMAGIDDMVRGLLAGLAAIREIETDMRLAGLNAAFKCARLGEKGRALAAITRELRSHAWQMAEGVAALSVALEAALAAGDSIMAAGGAGQAGTLEATLAAMQQGLAGLQAAGGDMDDAIARLRQDGSQVADVLTGISAGLDGAGSLSGLLDDVAAEVEALPSPEAPMASAELLRERLGLVNAVPYTMAREREIARDFGAELEEPVVAEAALDDILF